MKLLIQKLSMKCSSRLTDVWRMDGCFEGLCAAGCVSAAKALEEVSAAKLFAPAELGMFAKLINSSSTRLACRRAYV